MLRVPTGRPRIDGTLSLDLNSLENCRAKTSHGNAEVWKAWKAIKPAFHSSHTPWKSLRGFPHYHGYGDDYHVSEDRQSPPKTRNQSHSHRKGLVNHVPGLKRKGCPGTLKDTKMWPFAPSNIWRISMQAFDSNWRPRRDLNPCYRRERFLLPNCSAARFSNWRSHAVIVLLGFVHVSFPHAASNTPLRSSLFALEGTSHSRRSLRQSRS